MGTVANLTSFKPMHMKDTKKTLNFVPEGLLCTGGTLVLQ